MQPRHSLTWAGLLTVLCWMLARFAAGPTPAGTAAGSGRVGPKPGGTENPGEGIARTQVSRQGRWFRAVGPSGPTTEPIGPEALESAGTVGISARLASLETSRREWPSMERDRWLQGKADEWVSSDPDRAREFLGAIPDFRDQRILLDAKLKALARGDHRAAADWVAGLALPELSARAHEGLARDWARQDVDAVIDWINRLERLPDQVAAGRGLMWAWAQEDLEGSLAWAEQLEPSRFRDGVYLVTAKLVALDQPARAAAWASAFPEPALRNRALTYALHQWADRQPEEAATWSAGLEDPGLRAEAVAVVLSKWRNADPEAAGGWLAATEE